MSIVIDKISTDILKTFKEVDEVLVDEILRKELSNLNKKIVVLDDDPTGVQTVHNISVYTNWSVESIKEGFMEENNMFFILTNSRGFTVEETSKAHVEIANNVVEVAKELDKDFIIISRSDSTMRGHFPLETNTLKTTIETTTSKKFDGEILMPFFKEGGRFTIDNIHYVRENDTLVPAGMTEFAKDKTFAYNSSDVRDYCEEKTKGEYKASDVVCISLDEIRNLEFDTITEKLMSVENFNKIVVNAIDYVDAKIFAISLIRAINNNKEFMLRSAAAITKVLGGVSDKSLLTKKDLVDEDNKNGGIVIVGSYVNKTTMQLENMKTSTYDMEFVEFNPYLVLEEGGLDREVDRVIKIAQENIVNGRSVVVYTKRDVLILDTEDKDKQLMVSVQISDAVTSIVGKLNVRPSFIVAKGGITSSDVGTKALRVKKANVMGQIKPGIPVWMTGEESKFSNMPYVIFPGNVGEVSTLREVVETLIG